MTFQVQSDKNNLSELNSSLKINIIIMECYAKSLARIESDWTFSNISIN